MSFELQHVVPWGRNLDEYTSMFNLSEADYNRQIISFGDGPASFNKEMSALGRIVASLDPIYQFSKEELQQRIDETKETIIEQTQKNADKFVWHHIKSVDELVIVRLSAMTQFLVDFELGKQERRYIYHELPQRTHFPAQSFDLGLSSHFLILYSQLGLDFHIGSITEMLRLCNEVRIFPILNLNAKRSEVLEGIINHFNSQYEVEIVKVGYEFQKNGNQMLSIKSK